jgi:hypothetical protein
VAGTGGNEGGRAETGGNPVVERRPGTRRGRGAGGSGEDDRRGAGRREAVVVGLLAAPGISYEIAEQLQRELPGMLRRRFPSVQWRVELRPEPLAAASESDVDLVQIAHQRMLAEGWKLAVCLTDFPVHVGTRPVTAHASASHGVGLVSVPALGAINLDDRVREAVLRVIEGLLGETVDDPEQADDRERQVRMRQRLQDLQDLSSTMGRAEVREGRTFQFVAAVGLGNLRLLFGMVRANRPYRLIAGLSRAIVAALGLDIFGVASPGVWMIADGMGWVRLVIVSVAAILVTCVSLIAGHRLWERTYSDRREAHERLTLFNLATTITVTLGVLTLYAALFVINFVSSIVLITEGVLQRQINHPPSTGTYFAVACLVTTLATLGGALGAALENDRAVREAAYGYHPDARTEALQQQSADEEPGQPAPAGQG